jgi:DNA topoisomerase I
MPVSEELEITKRQLRAALKDAPGSAKAANLSYTNDSSTGIQRKRKGEKFIYLFNNKQIKDTEELLRIKSLSIPPAWERVWICPDEKGHLQATGYDSVGRKQYRYHPLWSKIRSHTKYYRLLDFGLSISGIRQNIASDLKKPGLVKEKVLAVIIAILDSTYLRIGNSVYEKLNGSYGLTTLKNKHVKIEGSTIKFRFIGKKGIRSNVSLRNRKISGIIKKCREIPGQQLFGYVNEQGEVQQVDSGMVNEYIREISGNDFTAKDFRTWAGSVSAIRAFNEIGSFRSQTEMKRNINKMYDIVAQELGNTRNICKTHYVHPKIVKLYEESKLDRFSDTELPIAPDNITSLLKSEEISLLKILNSK